MTSTGDSWSAIEKRVHYVRVARISTVLLDRSRLDRLAVARERPASVSHYAADRCGDWIDLLAPLVLVADQRVERALGDGHLVLGRRLLRARPRIARFAPLDPISQVGAGSRDHYGGLVDGHVDDTGRRIARHLQSFYDRIRPFEWGWKKAVETIRRKEASPRLCCAGFSVAWSFTQSSSVPDTSSTATQPGVFFVSSSQQSVPLGYFVLSPASVSNSGRTLVKAQN